MRKKILCCFSLAVSIHAISMADQESNEIYTVADGYKVDKATLSGFKTWRAAACDRCHGANQEGSVGPSLIVSLKTLTRDDFKRTVTDGRGDKGMPSFRENSQVITNLENLYRYLKGRSNGDILRAKVESLE